MNQEMDDLSPGLQGQVGTYIPSKPRAQLQLGRRGGCDHEVEATVDKLASTRAGGGEEEKSKIRDLARKLYVHCDSKFDGSVQWEDTYLPTALCIGGFFHEVEKSILLKEIETSQISWKHHPPSSSINCMLEENNKQS